MDEFKAVAVDASALQGARAAERLRAASQAANAESIEAAREFEAYMLQSLLKQMRTTIGDGGLFEKKHTKAYEALLDEALSRRAAEAGSFGLARELLRSWGAEP